MPAATLTSKGQITLPKAVREHLHLAARDRVAFVILDDGQVVLRPMGRSVRELRGFLRREGAVLVPFEDLDRSVMTALAEDDERVRRDG